MAVWKDKFISPNKFSRPTTKITAVRKIVMHYTANNGATALNHFNYFNNLKNVYASAHLFVDKIQALCIIPLNEISYHANDGKYKGIPALKPNANFLSVGIELCMEKDGSFHPDTIKRAEDVAVELCRRYNLNPKTDIVRHYDVTRKNCPAPWVKNPSQFTIFKANVDKKLNGAKTASSGNGSKTVIGNAVIKVPTLNIRKSPDFNADVVGVALKNSKFSVYEIKSNFLRIGEGKWISNTDGKYATYSEVKIIDAIKDSIKEGEDGKMKLELGKGETEALATVMRHAKRDGFLSDAKWEKKVLDGSLTLSEAVYLSLLLDHRRYTASKK